MAFPPGAARMVASIGIPMIPSPNSLPVTSSLVRVLLLALLAASAAGRAEAQNAASTSATAGGPAVVSAEKTSYAEVTAQLDPGGSLYGYVSTSQWLDGLSGRVNGWRDAILSLPNLGASERSSVNKAFDLAARLIRNSGVESIAGVGVSGIALEKGFYQTKFVVQRDPAAKAAGIWTVFGRAPHPLVELDWLPADTAWAGFSDADIASIWTAFAEEAGRSEIVELSSGIEQLKAHVQQATGRGLDEWLASLGGRCGGFLTLNDSHRVSIPLQGGGTMEIPDPGLVLLIKVKDDQLFDWFDRTLQGNAQVERSDAGGLRMLTLPVPLPVSVTFRPTVARHGDYLMLASNDELIRKMIAVKDGKGNGVKSGPEFKRLAQGMPAEGNSFAFISERLGNVAQQVQSAILSQAGGPGNGPPAALLQKFAAVGQPVASLAVGRNSGQSWITVSHGSQQPANAVLLPLVVAPVAVVAAVTLPALAKAKGRAQSIACMNNLKQLGLAAKIYATDHNEVYPPDFLAMKEILMTTRVLVCPGEPNRGAKSALTWEDLKTAQVSYEYLGRDLKDSTPGIEKKVLFRCRIHGHVCLGDGAVIQKSPGAPRD